MSFVGELLPIVYTGPTPGADSNVYPLFDSTTFGLPAAKAKIAGTVELRMGKYWFATHGVRKLLLSLKGNQAGTLKWWTSSDRGVTWLQLGQEAIAAMASTTGILRDFLVAAEPDFKLEWTNGGSAQNPWIVNQVLDKQRAMF